MKNHNFFAVIYLATYYKVFHELSDVKKMMDVNLTGLVYLLEFSKKFNVEKFINTGSCFEYKIKNEPLKEEEPLKGWNLYVVTKIAAEKLVEYYVRKNNIKALTLRLFPPYGPYEIKDKFIPYIIKSALKNEKIEVSPSEQQ